MKKSEYLSTFLFILGGFMIGFGTRGMFSIKIKQHNIAEINELSSEVINSVALVGQTQSRVSDVLIKIMAKNDGVDLGKRSSGVLKYAEAGFPDDEYVQELLFSQVIADLKEIDKTVDTLWYNNIRQEESCNLILKHLENLNE